MNVFLEFKRWAAPRMQRVPDTVPVVIAELVVSVAGLLSANTVHAEERIYRCGNEYTNTVSEAQLKTCKLSAGGNVTVSVFGRALVLLSGKLKFTS